MQHGVSHDHKVTPLHTFHSTRSKMASDRERKAGRSGSHLEDGVGISHLETGMSNKW